MGLDNEGTKFTFAAHAAGVSFQKTAMLGRQNFFPSAVQLQRLLDRHQTGHSAEQFLHDSQSYAEKWLELLGATEVVAIDRSAYEGADIVTDLNQPISENLKNRFSAVLDGGCLEHVFNFPQAIRNCMEMLAVGGHFIGITPANNFCGHGFYQFSPELYFRIFSEVNGFTVRTILTQEGSTWFSVQDPDQFGGRVEMQNNRPTYLFVLARKTASREIFQVTPQQSDYARRWKANTSANDATHISAPAFSAHIRHLLPFKVKEALRPLVANLSIRHRYNCYRRLSEFHLLQGKF